MSHDGLKRARSWKRRIQPKEAYSSPGLLYSEASANACSQPLTALCDTCETCTFIPRICHFIGAELVRLAETG
jgi:hypothetical protein